MTFKFFCLSSDTFIQKTKKTYEDSRVRRNLSNINSELQDVQRIMVQNIDDVLQRGDALGGEFIVTCLISSGFDFQYVLTIFG